MIKSFQLRLHEVQLSFVSFFHELYGVQTMDTVIRKVQALRQGLWMVLLDREGVQPPPMVFKMRNY